MNFFAKEGGGGQHNHVGLPLKFMAELAPSTLLGNLRNFCKLATLKAF